LICFILLLTTSCFFEIASGIIQAESFLISEGFRSGFDALCVYVALVGLSFDINNPNPDKKYAFGYGRTQIVTAFGNAIFTLFTNLFALLEAVHHLYGGHSENHMLFANELLIFKILIEILIYFGLIKSIRKDDKSSTISDNIGIIAIKCLGFVITESLILVDSYILYDEIGIPLYTFVPILNILWILVCMGLLRPYVVRNGKILLLSAPSGNMRTEIEKKLREISILEGVVSIKSEKFWMVTSSTLAGSVLISVERNANPQSIIMKSRDCLSKLIEYFTIELVVEDDSAVKNE